MHLISKEKFNALKRLSNGEDIIAALALDQRGSLKKMIFNNVENANNERIINFKKVVSEELTPFASSILLDPEYGLPASQVRAKNCGLILAYEKTGYDTAKPGRLPDLLDEWSVKRLKNQGADAIKVLIYYNVDADKKINNFKHVFVERIGSECLAEDLPFFLEIVTYDDSIDNVNSREYAKVKPHKVIEAMKEFSKPQYNVDVLKVEIPINMDYVEETGGNDFIYTKFDVLHFFKEQSNATHLPFIFLSAGISMKLFLEALEIAKEAGSSFNGVLCGRATWKDGAKVFALEGEKKGREWFMNKGKENITQLNQILNKTAHPWTEKVSILQ